MIEHHIVGLSRPALATGHHQHRRAALEHGGIRVAYWRCRLGTGDTRHCPDELDPWERLAKKAAAPPPAGPRPFCDVHPFGRERLYGRDRVCMECRNEKKRAWRAARREEGLRAA